jgi:hypothetical protein
MRVMAARVHRRFLYQVMREVRGSITESGTLKVAGSLLCGFMTSWGDGFFPVERELDAEGRLVRVRIELGCEAIVDRQRKFEDTPFRSVNGFVPKEHGDCEGPPTT